MTGRLLGPWLVLAVGVTASVVAVLSGQLRLGGYLLAAAFGLTALVRLTLPAQSVGAVAVRSRFVDVLGLSVTAMAVGVLTATLKLTV